MPLVLQSPPASAAAMMRDRMFSLPAMNASAATTPKPHQAAGSSPRSAAGAHPPHHRQNVAHTAAGGLLLASTTPDVAASAPVVADAVTPSRPISVFHRLVRLFARRQSADTSPHPAVDPVQPQSQQQTRSLRRSRAENNGDVTSAISDSAEGCHLHAQRMVEGDVQSCIEGSLTGPRKLSRRELA